MSIIRRKRRESWSYKDPLCPKGHLPRRGGENEDPLCPLDISPVEGETIRDARNEIFKQSNTRFELKQNTLQAGWFSPSTGEMPKGQRGSVITNRDG